MTLSQFNTLFEMCHLLARRPFAYITQDEVETLAVSTTLPYGALWKWFKEREFIIANSKAEARQIHEQTQELPF